MADIPTIPPGDTGYRFIGGPEQTFTHIAKWSEVEKWIHSTSRIRAAPIDALCGYQFRPVWSGVSILDTDALCEQCADVLIKREGIKP